MNIIISNRQNKQKLDLSSLKKQIRKILKEVKCMNNVELSLVVTDDVFIAELNEQYRGIKKPTNVLAFPMAKENYTKIMPWLLGDVVVSIDTVWRESEAFGLDPYEHFLRLIIHGILHLIGYDHLQNNKQAQLMEEMTEELLAKSKS